MIKIAPPAEQTHPLRRAAVIYNPTKTMVDQLRRATVRFEEEFGWSHSVWLETTTEDSGQGQAHAALRMGVDLVIAAGGDGTVRSVADAVRGSRIPLGIVPAGTGNLLARNLGIPVNDMATALRIAFGGDSHTRDRVIDVMVVRASQSDGTIEEHVSLVITGVGIDATMISKTSPALKKRLGWLAYVDASLRAVSVAKPFRIHYRLDERHSHRARVSSILMANLGNLPGGIELVPDAAIDDGLLDVVVLQPKNLFGWLFIWLRVTWENKVLRKSALGRSYLRVTTGKRTEILNLRARHVRIEMEDDEPRDLEIDGDEFGTVAAVDIWSDPGALVVRVPHK